MYVLITHHNELYQPLADLTWEENKIQYAELHDYAYYARTENFTSVASNSVFAFEKIHIALDVIDQFPECKWLWWTGTDSIITNYSIKIEDRIDDNYHIIVSVDVNGINEDSMLIRNSPEGISFLKDINALEFQYAHFWDAGQRALSNLLGFPGTSLPGWPFGKELIVNEKYRNVVKLVPQRYMNSYNYDLYREYPDTRDRFGVDGNWQQGDWLIHWPAQGISDRIRYVNYYKNLIVK